MNEGTGRCYRESKDREEHLIPPTLSPRRRLSPHCGCVTFLSTIRCPSFRARKIRSLISPPMEEQRHTLTSAHLLRFQGWQDSLSQELTSSTLMFWSWLLRQGNVRPEGVRRQPCPYPPPARASGASSPSSPASLLLLGRLVPASKIPWLACAREPVRSGPSLTHWLDLPKEVSYTSESVSSFSLWYPVGQDHLSRAAAAGLWQTVTFRSQISFLLHLFFFLLSVSSTQM